MQTLPKPHKIDAHPLLQRCPTLAGEGIAVEYFPRYVNRTYHPLSLIHI